MPAIEFRRARWALAVMFLLNGFAMGAWAPQIPLLLVRHGISESILGLLILGLGIGAVAAMVFSGRLVARFGSVAVTRFFALLLVPALPLIVAAPVIGLLAPAMAAFGAVAGLMDVAMNANAVEVERRVGRAIMSSSHGFWSLGGFLGGTFGSWLIGATSAMTQALTVAGVMFVALALAAPLLRGEAPAPAAARAAASEVTPARTGLLPRSPGIWLLGMMGLFCMVPEGAILDWAAIYLGKELGAGPRIAGLGFAFFSGMMAAIRFAGDGLRNRFGAVRILRASTLIGAAGLLLAAFSPFPALAILGFALAGLGLANTVPVMFSAAGNFPGQSSSHAIAVVTMVGYAGILVAPASIGFVAERAGFRLTFVFLAGLLVVVSLLARRAAIADNRRTV